jgi:membrane protease YdiL (CAAX protease family)
MVDPTSHMPFTLAILATILLYIWILEPLGIPVAAPAGAVVVLTVWSGLRTRTLGLSLKELVPASREAVIFTIPAVLVVLAAGLARGSLHNPGSLLNQMAALVVWGGAQQWVLQTVVLREARRRASPAICVVLAAALFAIVHLPNPFLTLMTFIGALGWCAIFLRHPNFAPLALSHAVATLALLAAFDDGVTGRLRIGIAYLMLHR